MKKIRKIFKHVVIMGGIALFVTGCAVENFDGNLSPDIDRPINSDPKRPIPIKPKRNPGGKIERPKLVEDLINKITTNTTNSGVICHEEIE